MPFHQLDFPFCDLDSGDAAGMNTAPVIEVGGLPFSGKNRFVGVADDDGGFCLYYPAFESVIGSEHHAVISCRTGGVGDSDYRLEEHPDFPDNKSSKPPAGVIEAVSLVAVKQEDFVFLLFVLEDQEFVDG